MFLSIGIIGSIPQTSSTSIGIGALMILITFAYSISVGPACKQSFTIEDRYTVLIGQAIPS